MRLCKKRYGSQIAGRPRALTPTSSAAGQRLMYCGGFTLVEILVVLTIIGLVMALVGPRVLGYLSDSKIKAAKIQMENIGSSLDLYYLDTGRYPATSEGLVALFKAPNSDPSWRGPYMNGSTSPNDPWGHMYIYRSPGKQSGYELVSGGPEGREDGLLSIHKHGGEPR